MISPFDKLLYSSFRLIYYLLYHQFAWSYDLVAGVVSLGSWQRWVKSALPYLKGPRILEIGYGPGHLQVVLRENGIFAAGLDASPQMAHQACARLKRAGLKPAITLGYAQNMPFQSALFNQVVATFPSEYIFHPQTLSEIYRVLTQGGILIVIPFAWPTDNRWYARVMSKLLRVAHESPDWDSKFLQPFEEAGFQTRLISLKLETSEILLIRAEKPYITWQPQANLSPNID
jgi:ubiquinone/menaquinone biosynthesis C-methylase UbiE